MSHLCANCGGPITGPGHAGRPWPDLAAAVYCCFGCLSLGEHDRQVTRTPGLAWKLDGLGVRVGLGVLVAGQSMIFGLALNLHDDVPAAARRVAGSLILGATVLVVALLGGPLVRTAWHDLRRGRLTIEALFLLTLSGAMAGSLQAYLTGRGKIYFEVVSILLVVYTLGKVIGARSRAAAVAGSRAWAGQLSTCRRVDGNGRARTVAVTEIRAGDVIEVDPGELIAVDGVIRRGTGFVSEAPVSGEPFAVVRRPGDRVLAGSASHDATFHIEATAAGTGRQVDELLAAVESARDRPASFQGQADRIGRAFFPLVVVTALGTFGYWSVLTPAGWEVGLFHAMSVLLVACPCVIGLATPIVIWSAIGRLAERGVIVRAGNVIERLAAVDRVLFDKTGTLTDDRFALLDIVTAAEGDKRAKVLGWVALVESHSTHPIAKPFAQLPRPFAPGEEPRVWEVKAIPGCGVEAAIEEVDGRRHDIRLGRPEWVGGGRTPRPPWPEPGPGEGGPCWSPSPLEGEGSGVRGTTGAPPRAFSGLDRRPGMGRSVPSPPTPLPQGERGENPPFPRSWTGGKGEPETAGSSSPPFLGEGPGERFPGHRIDISIDGELAAVAVVAERLRDSVPVMLADFRALGLPVEVLTGDTAGRAAALGLPPTRAGLLPADKRARVNELTTAGAKPLMVGDGINDASALAAAHVGVGLASGTDLAVGAAAATLYHDDLRVLPWAIALSREAVRTVRRNLYRALAYNLIGMALAASGVLHPVVAVLLMMASSLSLIFSSTRVGVVPDHCSDSPASGGREPPECGVTGIRVLGGLTPPARRAVIHFAALVLQGFAFLLLLDSARVLPTAAAVPGGFALAGGALAYLWYRWATIPHTLDMCFGMLTLGNLGMLLGWWADNGFAPLHDGGCCVCVESARGGMMAPWMWVGMLLFANAAMLRLGRRPLPWGSAHVPAMFTGGNIGMVAGMAAGGWAAAHLPTDAVPLAATAGFAGMTAGMLAGMLLGTRVAEGLIAAGRTAAGQLARRGPAAPVSRTAGRSSTPKARTRSR